MVVSSFTVMSGCHVEARIPHSDRLQSLGLVGHRRGGLRNFRRLQPVLWGHFQAGFGDIWGDTIARSDSWKHGVEQPGACHSSSWSEQGIGRPRCWHLIDWWINSPDLFYWFIRSIDWLVDVICCCDWLDRLIDWFSWSLHSFAWLIDELDLLYWFVRLIGWLIDRLIDLNRLIDWLFVVRTLYIDHVYFQRPSPSLAATACHLLLWDFPLDKVPTLETVRLWIMCLCVKLICGSRQNKMHRALLSTFLKRCQLSEIMEGWKLLAVYPIHHWVDWSILENEKISLQSC